MRDGEGLVVDVDTWHLRQGRVLIQSTPEMIVFFALGARAQRIQRFAFDQEGESEPDAFLAHCHEAADAVERGNLHKAYGYGIPPSVFAMKDRNIRRLAIAEALARAGYDPDEPRVPAGSSDGGQWTSDGTGGSSDHNIVPAAAKPKQDSVAVTKQRFVDAHLADAQKIADELHVPVENILGLTALESTWGTHHFASEGNNFLGIESPAPFETGYVYAAENKKVKVATFASYADCLRAFVAESAATVRDRSAPSDFAAALQNSGKYGIDPVTGKKDPNYVRNVSATIVGLRSYVARSKA